MITYCDVNTCEECPRYGDDCDGSDERLYTHEEAWGMSDNIRRAEPTIIRSRTLMPTKDFKEWAKRIRETNPNAVIIPCDAEVVSVEAEWIPCSERLPSDDEYVIVSVLAVCIIPNERREP